MWKFMLIAGLLPLILSWAGRHWLWENIQGRLRLRDTGKSLAQLREALGLPPVKKAERTDLSVLAVGLREAGLELLEREGDQAAKARRRGVLLLRVLPVFVGIIAIFGILSKRVPAAWALSGAMACVGLLVLIRLMGLTVELRGVVRAAHSLKKTRFFNRVDDEDAVIAAAKRSIWLSVWPW